jgi:hypothetical protein
MWEGTTYEMGIQLEIANGQVANKLLKVEGYYYLIQIQHLENHYWISLILLLCTSTLQGCNSKLHIHKYFVVFNSKLEGPFKFFL